MFTEAVRVANWAGNVPRLVWLVVHKRRGQGPASLAGWDEQGVGTGFPPGALEAKEGPVWPPRRMGYAFEGSRSS